MPSSAIITNIDADHLDTYENIDAIKEAFAQFANKIPFYGQVIVCLDDPNVQQVLSRLKKPVITLSKNSLLSHLSWGTLLKMLLKKTGLTPVFIRVKWAVLTVRIFMYRSVRNIFDSGYGGRSI